MSRLAQKRLIINSAGGYKTFYRWRFSTDVIKNQTLRNEHFPAFSMSVDFWDIFVWNMQATCNLGLSRIRILRYNWYRATFNYCGKQWSGWTRNMFLDLQYYITDWVKALSLTFHCHLLRVILRPILLIHKNLSKMTYSSSDWVQIKNIARYEKDRKAFIDNLKVPSNKSINQYLNGNCCVIWVLFLRCAMRFIDHIAIYPLLRWSAQCYWVNMKAGYYLPKNAQVGHNCTHT